MKYHVQFLNLDLKGEVQDALGSDGVFILDGRNSLSTMEVDANKQFHRMNKHLHTYCGWEIRKGTRFDNAVPVKRWMLSGESTRLL